MPITHAGLVSPSLSKERVLQSFTEQLRWDPRLQDNRGASDAASPWAAAAGGAGQRRGRGQHPRRTRLGPAADTAFLSPTAPAKLTWLCLTFGACRYDTKRKARLMWRAKGEKRERKEGRSSDPSCPAVFYWENTPEPLHGPPGTGRSEPWHRSGCSPALWGPAGAVLRSKPQQMTFITPSLQRSPTFPLINPVVV